VPNIVYFIYQVELGSKAKSRLIQKYTPIHMQTERCNKILKSPTKRRQVQTKQFLAPKNPENAILEHTVGYPVDAFILPRGSFHRPTL